MALIKYFLLATLITIINFNLVKAEEFIIGLYAFPNKRYIDLVADSKLKYLILYGTDGVKDKLELEKLLNYAEERNVKIIFSLKDCYKSSKWYPNIIWCDNSNEIELIKCIVNNFDQYKSIVGYYLGDDSTYTIGNKNLDIYLTHVKNIRNMSRKSIFIHEVPPPEGKLFEIFSQTSDYIIVGFYPIPDQKIQKIYDVIKFVVDKYEKPVIAVIQAHGKYQYPFYKKDEVNGRAPTFEELRMMSYLAISAGAKGIIYYSLFDVENLPDGMERLIFLKELAQEISIKFNK